MDILDILLDILLKPLQPFIGLCLITRPLSGGRFNVKNTFFDKSDFVDWKNKVDLVGQDT